jgi:alanine dehydrogenase
MQVGVPKEIKLDEYRVGATPASVREYCAHGHDVTVESGAGSGLGISDAIYSSAGATIVDTAEEVFDKADMIVKVKEPQSQEWRGMRPEQILFTYLHLAADAAQAGGSWNRDVMSTRCRAVCARLRALTEDDQPSTAK